MKPSPCEPLYPPRRALSHSNRACPVRRHHVGNRAVGVELVLSDSPELAGQKLLDSLPDGCELETSVEDTGAGWKATACIMHPTDSPKPSYVGRGVTADEALLAAIKVLANFWTHRFRNRGSNC